MIIPAQILDIIRPIEPWCQRTKHNGMTYGLSPAGYDIRVAENLTMVSNGFKLASSLERFKMPNDLLARVCDKSTWARRGLFVQNTVIEPGWGGSSTLELTYHGFATMSIWRGDPIAQIIFERLEAATDQPYRGKYQNQPEGAQKPILEESDG